MALAQRHFDVLSEVGDGYAGIGRGSCAGTNPESCRLARSQMGQDEAGAPSRKRLEVQPGAVVGDQL